MCVYCVSARTHAVMHWFDDGGEEQMRAAHDGAGQHGCKVARMSVSVVLAAFMRGCVLIICSVLPQLPQVV